MTVTAIDRKNSSPSSAQLLTGSAESTRTSDTASTAESEAFDARVAQLLAPKRTPNQEATQAEQVGAKRGKRRVGAIDPADVQVANGLGVQWRTLVTDTTKVDVADRNAAELQSRGEQKPGSERDTAGKERPTASGSDNQASRQSQGAASEQAGRQSQPDASSSASLNAQNGLQSAGLSRRSSTLPQATSAVTEPKSLSKINVAAGMMPTQKTATTTAVARAPMLGSQPQSSDKPASTPNVIAGVTAAKNSRGDAFKQLMQAGQPARHAVEQQQTTGVALKALGLALKQGGGEVTMKLAPEALGQVKVKLNVRETSIDATFTTTTASARRLLEASTDTLRDALEARGLRVDSIAVEGPRTDAQPAINRSADAAQDAQQHASRENGQGGALTSATDGNVNNGPGGDTAGHREQAAANAQYAQTVDQPRDAEVQMPLEGVAWDVAPGERLTAMGIEWVA